MKYDARKLSTAEKAKLRKEAVRRVLEGQPVKEVTKHYGLGDKTIFKWLKKARESGLGSLEPIPRSGRNRTLSTSEERVLRKWLLMYPPSHFGYAAPLWNAVLVKEFIQTKLQIELSSSSVHRLLHRLALAPRRERTAKGRPGTALLEPWQSLGFEGLNKLARKRSAKSFWLTERSFAASKIIDVPQAESKELRFLCIASGAGGFRYSGVSGLRFEADFMAFIRTFAEANKENAFLFVMPGLLPENTNFESIKAQLPPTIELILTTSSEAEQERDGLSSDRECEQKQYEN